MSSPCDRPAIDAGQGLSQKAQKFARPLSNTSRKRIATPNIFLNHSSEDSIKTRKRFENVQQSSQVDTSFASSPFESVASCTRLGEERLPKSAITPDLGNRYEIQSPTKGFRISSAFELVAGTASDVREPCPADSPELPSQTNFGTNETDEIAAEPLSSGFSSPAVHKEEISATPISENSILSRDTDATQFDKPCSEETTREYLEQPLTILQLTDDLSTPLRRKRTWDSPDGAGSLSSSDEVGENYNVSKHRPKDRAFRGKTFQILDDHGIQGVEPVSNLRATIARSKSHDSLEVCKELSPNVTPWRKGTPASRKKRRPSYWDSDLEAIRNSPAARHVHPAHERQLTALPLKADAVAVWEAKTGFEDIRSTGENKNVAWESGDLPK